MPERWVEHAQNAYINLDRVDEILVTGISPEGQETQLTLVTGSGEKLKVTGPAVREILRMISPADFVVPLSGGVPVEVGNSPAAARRKKLPVRVEREAPQAPKGRP